MTKRDERLNISLTKDTKDKLALLAAIDGTNTATLANRALQAYVESRAREVAEFTAFVQKLREKTAE